MNKIIQSFFLLYLIIFGLSLKGNYGKWQEGLLANQASCMNLAKNAR